MLIRFDWNFRRNDEYHEKTNWSPESSVKGGFDAKDIQDIHDIHDMPDLQGKIILMKYCTGM